jgi:hypothetical protein
MFLLCSNDLGEPLWLSGKVVKNETIKEIERTRVRSPPRATSFFKKKFIKILHIWNIDPVYLHVFFTEQRRIAGQMVALVFSPAETENRILKAEVALLQSQLQFERHRREVLGVRNRRLLGKTRSSRILEEQNTALVNS